MPLETWRKTLERLSPDEVFRVVLAGYGEVTTHPRFAEFVEAMRDHPVRFDMVSNGHLLDAEKIARLDGVIDLLIVSFSSIDPEVYGRVHANLDQQRVMENIKRAQEMFRHTKLGISLTPMPECLPSLPDTIGWLRAQGIDLLTMSPTLYNRGGSLKEYELASSELRRLISEHGLHSQELDFIPGVGEIYRQWRSNRFKCVPRNVDLFVAANGEYLYCYNDAAHRNAIGNVMTDSIAQTIRRREDMAAIDSLCGPCNMRDRYGPAELLRVGMNMAGARLRRAG
jgi:MoaA/NifB/PqqE/SkfB family radical SAM enzyme